MADDRAVAPEIPDPGERSTSAAVRIDEFVAQRLARLASRLPASDLPLDRDVAQEIDALDGLSRLREKHLQQKTSPRRPVLIPVLAAVTAVIVTLSVFLRVPSIAVELEVNGTAASFRTVRDVQLTDGGRLTALSVSAFAPTEIEEPLDLRVFALVPPMDVRPGEAGSITLAPLNIPAGSRVTIQQAGIGKWQLDIEPSDKKFTGAATLAGPILMSAGSLPEQQIDFSRGARVELRAADPPPPARARLLLLVSPQEIGSFFADAQIEIDQLSFDQEEVINDEWGVGRSRRSSVLGGEVINQSASGRKTALRQRTTVRLDVIGGQLSELRLDPTALHVVATLSARDVSVGTPVAMSTLRPSWLEWLAHHHTLQLVWGSAAWLLALLIGGVRWWRKPDIEYR